jgi:hypothetical protein
MLFRKGGESTMDERIKHTPKQRKSENSHAFLSGGRSLRSFLSPGKLRISLA